MPFLITNKKLNFELSTIYKKKFEYQTLGDANIYYDKNKVFTTKDDNSFSIICGYVNNLKKNKVDTHLQNLSVIKKVETTWPLPKHITGSFSIVSLLKNKPKIIICNDVIGPYPLYYYLNKEEFVISSSIISIAIATNQEFDYVGIAQCTIGSEFSNLGSRTILLNVKRLLPGEYIDIDTNNFLFTEKKYDNTLYEIKSSKKPTRKYYEDYWEKYKQEIEFALSHYNKHYLALSGGMDSRILLGAIPENNALKCLTYGEKDAYETKIAGKLAKHKKYVFKNFFNPRNYFPSKETLNDYTLQTEALNIASWIDILENTNPENNAALLLGDMCEVLPARNIKTYSSRKARIRNFIKVFLFRQPLLLSKCTPNDFEKWKAKIIDRELKNYTSERTKAININLNYHYLVSEIKLNLKELFDRIEAHNLPYVELYDELYAWYTHARIPMSKQILVCNKKFKAICPSMSLGILRESSSIHPKYRLNYYFMHKLFLINNELKKIYTVPTNQAPIIPHHFPRILTTLVWGIRSKIDQFLINRIVKKRNPNLRYRLFKSLNWVQIYQNDKIKNNMDDYFKNNEIGNQLVDNIKKTIKGRQDLKKWPLSNIDVISLASLNAQINFIKEFRKQIN